MSAEESKALVRQVIAALNEAWAAGDWDAVAQYIAPNYVYQDANNPLHGPAGYRALLTIYSAAFPDVQFTIDDIFAEGDNVALRVTATGTHRGEFMGVAPTGKRVTISAVNLLRIENGKIVEECERFDLLNMLQQLGAAPVLSQATA